MMASVGPSPNFRNGAKQRRIPAMFAAICASVSNWRDSSLPDGSPMRVVPPPISATGRWPCFCSRRRIMMPTRLPTCRLSAVQSKPIYADTTPARSAASSASVSVHWKTKPRSVASCRNGLSGMMAGPDRRGAGASTDGGGRKMLRVVGLMSGTSLDGVDAAWLETDGEGDAVPGPSLGIVYDEPFRARLRALLGGRAPDEEVAAVERELTLRHAAAVEALVLKVGRGAPDLIGFHGQTIL